MWLPWPGAGYVGSVPDRRISWALCEVGQWATRVTRWGKFHAPSIWIVKEGRVVANGGSREANLDDRMTEIAELSN